MRSAGSIQHSYLKPPIFLRSNDCLSPCPKPAPVAASWLQNKYLNLFFIEALSDKQYHAVVYFQSFSKTILSAYLRLDKRMYSSIPSFIITEFFEWNDVNVRMIDIRRELYGSSGVAFSFPQGKEYFISCSGSKKSYWFIQDSSIDFLLYVYNLFIYLFSIIKRKAAKVCVCLC